VECAKSLLRRERGGEAAGNTVALVVVEGVAARDQLLERLGPEHGHAGKMKGPSEHEGPLRVDEAQHRS
jgi:hypothetical protein